jgi:hypothetical protein
MVWLSGWLVILHKLRVNDVVELVLNVLVSIVMFQDLTKKWSDVRQLVPQRDQTLQAELRKQQSILV